MADWVHCNTCFRQPGDGSKFILTSCGHTFCAVCAEKLDGKCSLCSTACTTIQLSSSMKPDVQAFFTDPIELFTKYQKQLLNVMQFQKSHRQRLVAHQQEIRRRLKQQDEALLEMRTRIGDLEKAMIATNEENTYLKSLLASRAVPASAASCRRRSPAVPSPQSQDVLSMSSRVSGNTPYRNTSSSESRTTPTVPGRISLRPPPRNGSLEPIPGTPGLFAADTSRSSPMDFELVKVQTPAPTKLHSGQPPSASQSRQLASHSQMCSQFTHTPNSIGSSRSVSYRSPDTRLR